MLIECEMIQLSHKKKSCFNGWFKNRIVIRQSTTKFSNPYHQMPLFLQYYGLIVLFTIVFSDDDNNLTHMAYKTDNIESFS